MSALPKRSNTNFWMEARTVEIPFPQPAPAEMESVARTKPVVLTPTIPLSTFFSLFLRFERSISIAVIVFSLMILSSISYQTLNNRFDARENQSMILDTKSEISRLREELQLVRSSVDSQDSLSGIIALPVDPDDVAIVTLKPWNGD